MSQPVKTPLMHCRPSLSQPFAAGVLVGLFCLTGLAIGWAVAAEVPTLSTPPRDLASIQGEEVHLREVITYLASDELEGRDTGSPGMQAAAEFLLKEYQAAGLTFPPNLPDGIQTFPIESLPELGEENQLSVTVGSETRELEIDADFVPCSFGGTGQFSAPVVFCGYGIQDKQGGYNDFANVDVKGKVVMLLRRVPGQTQPGSRYVREDGTVDLNRAALRTKLTLAREHGAVGVLFVNDPFTTRSEQDKLLDFGYGGTAKPTELPVLQITQEQASELLKLGTGQTLAELDEIIEATLQPVSTELKNLTVSGQADLNYETVLGKNLIGVIEPENPETRETIVIGAHYDHIGWGRYGSRSPGTLAIHNGADDNASGTTAVVALAHRLAPLAGKLSRRIVFICFSGEERGLLGSKYYTENPVYPLDETLAMLNLDMVGRMSDEKLTIFGVGSSPIWNPWLDELESALDLYFHRDPKSLGPSDHRHFFEQGVPVLHLFTGLHEDYHRPTDVAKRINVQGIRRSADVVHGLTLALAQTSEVPEYVENKKWIQVGNHAGGRAFVGLIPDLQHREPGYRLRGLEPGSPALQAGLEPGDILLSINGKPIQQRSDFWGVVDSKKPKDTVKIEFLRDGETHTTNLQLSRPR